MKSCLKEVICKATLLLVHLKLIFFSVKKPKTCQIVKEFINILTIGVATRKLKQSQVPPVSLYLL